MAALYLDQVIDLLNLCPKYKSQALLKAIYKIVQCRVLVGSIGLLLEQTTKLFK
jgi:hypothetical protein